MNTRTIETTAAQMTNKDIAALIHQGVRVSKALRRWDQWARDNNYSTDEAHPGYCSFLAETRAALAGVDALAGVEEEPCPAVDLSRLTGLVKGLLVAQPHHTHHNARPWKLCNRSRTDKVWPWGVDDAEGNAVGRFTTEADAQVCIASVNGNTTLDH